MTAVIRGGIAPSRPILRHRRVIASVLAPTSDVHDYLTIVKYAGVTEHLAGAVGAVNSRGGVEEPRLELAKKRGAPPSRSWPGGACGSGDYRMS